MGGSGHAPHHGKGLEKHAVEFITLAERTLEGFGGF